MKPLFIVLFVLLAYCTKYSLGQSLIIGPPNSVSVNWPSNENLMDLRYWFNYLIFVAIVLVVIILIGILLEIFDCCVWCSRRCCNCCGGSKLKNYDPYSGPGYSKTRVCCTGTLILLVFLVLLGAGGVFIAFNALFSLHVRTVIETTNGALKGVNGTLNGVITATSKGLPDAISSISTRVQDLTIAPAKVVCNSIDTVSQVLYDVNSRIEDINVIVYELNNTIPTQIGTIYNNALSKITYNQGSVSGLPSDALDSISTGSFESSITFASNKMAQALTAITGVKTQCLTQVNNIESQITNTQTGVFANALVTAQNSLFQTINTFSTTLNQIGISQIPVYTSYVTIGDSVRLAVELVIVALPLLMFLVVIIGCCANKKFLFKAPACCLFFSFWLFFIISSLHIAGWIIAKDICKEVPKRQDTLLELVGNLTGNPLSQFNTSIPAAAKGILNCKTDFISEALGGQDKAVSIVKSVIGFDSSLESTISSLTSNIKIGDGISGSDISNTTFSSLNVDYNSLTSVVVSKFDTFKQSLINIQTNADTVLNNTIAQMNDSSITRESVKTYCQTHNDTLCTKYKEYVAASSQLTSVMVELAKIDAQFALMKSKIEQINAIIITDIKTAPQKLTTKANEVLASVTNLVNTIKNSVPILVNTAVTTILDVFSNALSCTYIPTTINNLDRQFCSGVVIDSIIVGVSSFVVGILCAFGFILILLIDKYRTYQLKVEKNKGKKDKPKKSDKKSEPLDLLRQIELTESEDNTRAKDAAPALDDLSPPTYEESSTAGGGKFYY